MKAGATDVFGFDFSTNGATGISAISVLAALANSCIMAGVKNVSGILPINVIALGSTSLTGGGDGSLK